MHCATKNTSLSNGLGNVKRLASYRVFFSRLNVLHAHPQCHAKVRLSFEVTEWNGKVLKGIVESC